MGRLIRRLIDKKWAGNAQRDQVRLASQPLPQGWRYGRACPTWRTATRCTP